MNKKLTAVTIGDIEGIGIEQLINLWNKKKINNFVLITNYIFFKKYLNKNKIKLPIKLINKNNLIKKNKNKNFLIYDYKAKNNIENTYLSLKFAYMLCIKNYCSGIITLPLNKAKIKRNIDKNFIGQTEFFQKLDKKEFSNMIFYSKKLIVSPLTTHIPINKINFFLNKNQFIYNKSKLLVNTLKIDFKIKKPKIIISGINPHAGENGEIGTEEIKYLIPILKKLKLNKILIDGPNSPDSLFTKENIENYDCFICIYHDQALIPFKLISGFRGINFTGSLDVIRLSPDHGTAYKLVGTKKSNFESLYYCFKMINKFSYNRNKIV